jgi:transglutaminase/protease-like cytokinesis protein 3
LLVTCLYGCLSDPQAFGCLVLVAVHISSFSQNPPAPSSVSKYNQRHGLSSKFRTKTTSEKQGESEREREQPTEPTCEIWFSFALSDAEDVNRRTEEEDEGRAAHKGKGFRHRQGQRREGRQTPGARSPIGKATEQNGELPLFCYFF